MRHQKIAIIIVTLTVIILAAIGGEIGFNRERVEPKKRPDLPASVKWNQDKGQYYDGRYVKWNPEKQIYESIEVSSNTDIDDKDVQRVALFDELDEQSNEYVNKLIKSNDKVDMTLVMYSKAMKDYCEEHPEILFSSKWEVGQGGPLEIIKGIEFKDYNKLIKHVRTDSPFCAPIMIAVEEVTKTRINNIDTSQTGIEKWKQSLKGKEKEARSKIEQIVGQLEQGNSESSEQIRKQISEMGIFAYPAIYDELKANPDSDLKTLVDGFTVLTQVKTETSKDEKTTVLISGCKSEEKSEEFIRSIMNLSTQ